MILQDIYGLLIAKIGLMKFICILFIFSIVSFSQELCIERVEKLCDRPSSTLHQDYHEVKKKAFRSILDEEEFQDMVCRNFVAQADGSFGANFSWVRDCDSKWAKELVDANNIADCEDFFAIGAGPYFVDFCRKTVAKTMTQSLKDRHYTEFEQAMNEVLDDYKKLLVSFGASDDVERLFSTILPTFTSKVNLGEVKPVFFRVSELCNMYPEKQICKLYKDSLKLILVPGGSIFLPYHHIKAGLAQTVAGLLAEKMHNQLLASRMNVFFRLFPSNQRLESIVARASVSGSMNFKVNAAILLSKYFELNSTSPTIEDELSFICLEKNNSVLNPNFPTISILEEMKIMTCLQ